MGESTVKLAETPLNFTAVAPVKFVPVIVTLVVTSPLVGVNEMLVGGRAKGTVLSMLTEGAFRRP